jgi:hypothetical protein
MRTRRTDNCTNFAKVSVFIGIFQRLWGVVTGTDLSL